MTQRQQLGRRGEEIARSHLEAVGYSIIDTNHRVGRNEVDIIAENNGDLVFVEVRTRRGSSLGTPEESITPTKQSRMIAAAEEYIQNNGLLGAKDWRIDVVAVEMDSRGSLIRVEVIANALEQ